MVAGSMSGGRAMAVRGVAYVVLLAGLLWFLRDQEWWVRVPVVVAVAGGVGWGVERVLRSRTSS